MKRPKKILIVHNSSLTFLTQRFPVALGALAAGYEVHVATPDDGGGDEIRSKGFFFHPIKMTRRGMNIFREFATVLELRKLYREIEPDLAHHVTIKPILYGGWASRWAKVPAVVSIVTGLGYVFLKKGLFRAVLRFVIKKFYAKALSHRRSRVIFQNPDNLKAFVDWGLVSKRRSILIKGSGVDMKKFAPVDEAGEVPVVVLAARMLWEKGIQEYVEAAKNIKNSGVTARFVLVGDIDEGNPTSLSREQLQTWVREGFVEWWGRQSDMVSVFSKCHLVCLPSYYPEGTPLVLIEAAACGKAIITTDEPGCRQVVFHGVNGLLVPSRNVAALTEALRELILNSEKRRDMGVKGREIVKSEFSKEEVVRKTLDVYEELLNPKVPTS